MWSDAGALGKSDELQANHWGQCVARNCGNYQRRHPYRIQCDSRSGNVVVKDVPDNCVVAGNLSIVI